MNRKPGIFASTLLAILFLGGVLAAHGSAALPGKNGKLLLGQGTLPDLELSYVRAGGTSAIPLAIEADFLATPRWSSSGRAVLVNGAAPVTGQGPETGVFSFPVAGRPGALVWKISDPILRGGPTVMSPEGGRLMTTVHEVVTVPASGWEIDPDSGVYVRNLDGKTTRRLDLGQGIFPTEATFSPNGRRIAFVARNEATSAETSIHVAYADGTRVRELARNLDFAGGLDFSPDGERLAYHAFRTLSTSRETEVVRVDLFETGIDDGRTVQLTSTGNNVGPIYSPDGTRIAYTKMNEGDIPDAVVGPWILNSDGGTERPIDVGGEPRFVADWSRSAPFVIKRFDRRRAVLRVRVFGPGKLVVSGRHIKKSVKATGKTGIIAIPVTPRGNIRLMSGAKLNLKVRFAPTGGLPSTIKKTIRLGGR